MDFQQFVESALALFKNSNGNVLYVLYAIVVVLLTQVVKKLVVDKVKVEILHGFDMAVVLPFMLGVVLAVFDKIVVYKTWEWTGAFVYNLLLQGVSIGALASVMFKMVASLSGNKMSSLLKDDTFAVFYNQLLYFGSVKDQLAKGELKFGTFVDQVKLVVSNAKAIYNTEEDDMVKKSKLVVLLKGIITTDNFTNVIENIHKSLAVKYRDNTK